MLPSDEWMWLDARLTVTAGELARMCGLSEADIGELVEYGSLATVEGGGFTAELVTPLREAARLRARFDLDLFTAGLLAQYLHRIEQLERELRALRGRLHGEHGLREGPAQWREPHA